MDQFEVVEPLFPGAQAEVLVVIDKNDGKRFVLKKFLLEDSKIPRNVIREASLLYDLDHANIVKLEHVFVHQASVYMVLEHVSTDMEDHLELYHSAEYHHLAKKFLEQILLAISYCHSLGVVHRDIKPSNILVDVEKKIIKVADFGLARGFITPNQSLTPELATRNYRAPEVLMGSELYTSAIDIWSIGCVFAEMLMGRKLFAGSTEILVLDDIFSLLGIPSEKNWPGVSSIPGFQKYKEGGSDFGSLQGLGAEFECLKPVELDLLMKLLALDPASRISATEALKHAYFST